MRTVIVVRNIAENFTFFSSMGVGFFSPEKYIAYEIEIYSTKNCSYREIPICTSTLKVQFDTFFFYFFSCETAF